jgi:paraquat-inducible protein B
MAASFTDTMKKASGSLDQMRSTLETYQRLAEPSGTLGHDLTRMLGDLDAAARSVHSLADYLELHPEAILKGRQ